LTSMSQAQKYAVEKGTDICKDHRRRHHTKMIHMHTVIRVRTKIFSNYDFLSLVQN
jgi:hypothetical protein